METLLTLLTMMKLRGTKSSLVINYSFCKTGFCSKQIQGSSLSFVFLLNLIGSTKTGRVRANASEKEEQLVSDSYNMVNGKDWGAVVKMARERVLEYGLPPRVIKIYTENEEKKLITRMKNIMRRIRPSSSSSPSTSTTVSSKTHNDKMRYAVKRTPAQRKLESKLAAFIASSSEDSDEEEEKQKKTKTVTEVAKEAQEAHTTMCKKAMETLDKVGNLLTKVECQIDKSAKP